jgi:glycosyltransferase involved in cell wall biosynthesis
MESLSCGVPVCAFEVGGIPEMIVQSKTGMLCKKLDVNTMSSQIIELLELIKDQKDGIRNNCVEFAANHYSDSVIALEYMLLYN